MSDSGYNFPYVERPATETGHNARRYGVLDRSTATTWGFAPPVYPEVIKVRNTFDEYYLTASSQMLERLSGPDNDPNYSGDSCLNRALQELWPENRDPQSDLPQQLGLESFNATMESPATRATTAEWSSCMRRHGYVFDDPFSILSADYWRGTAQFEIGSEPAENEVAAALTDIECKNEVRFAATFLSVESELQLRLIAEHKADLVTVAAQLADRDRNVAEVLLENPAWPREG